MKKTARLQGDELKWSQPRAGKKEYHLHSRGELVATLKFRSMFGTFATAETGDDCWTFKRVGFWQNKATIRVCGSDTDLAAFRNNTWDGGGTLEFADGRKFKATTNSWGTRFEFQTETNQPLVHFRYGGLFRRSAEVEITPLARDMSYVPLLLLFGWYLVIMLDSDTAAVAAAIAAGS